MNNRKARLLLQVPAVEVGLISTYNISNTRRLFIIGATRGVIRRGNKPFFTPTGRRNKLYKPSIHNLPAKANDDDLKRLRWLFAEMPRLPGGVVYLKDI